MGFFTINNDVYCGLGQDNSMAKNDFWKYNSLTDTWTSIKNFPGTARLSPFAFGTCWKGYVGTGSSTGGANYSDSYIYDPGTDTWSTLTTFPGGARNSSIAASSGTKAYVSLGNSNSGWKKDLWEFDCGLSNIQEPFDHVAGLEMFPNPANTEFQIHSPFSSIGLVLLVDMYGKIAHQGNSTTIDVSNLSKGIYMVVIETSSGRVMKKLQKN